MSIFTKKRRRRLWVLLAVALAFSACMLFILCTLRDSIVFYRTPSELVGNPQLNIPHKSIRVGALVAHGSLHSLPDGRISFQLDDGAHHITVRYKGLLPSLFAEGRGAVVEGRFHQDHIFYATTVLAKHDANYRAPK